MAELRALVCPKCGAEVKLERGRERGTCTYCGTVAYVQNPRRDHARTGAPQARPHKHRGLVVLAALMVGALAVWFAVGLLSSGTPPPPVRQDKAPPPAVRAATTEAKAPAAPPAAKAPALQVQSYEPARLVDVDGDGTAELLLPFQLSYEDGRQKTSHFGVFSTHDGALRHATPALEQASDRVLSAVAYGRLLRAQVDGSLTSYDLASGNVQWTSVLGERVAALCEEVPPAVDTLHVTTDDGRNIVVDVKTGRQSESKQPCKVPLAVSSGRHAPSDRHDYRAPRGTEAWTCGGVRVMGSQNYRVPDACLARLQVDSDKLPGMVGHAIWRTPRGLLVFGVRQPGAYVPSVGLWKQGRWLWKNEVPARDPLAAELGGPRVISLHGDHLVVGYRADDAKNQWVTRFDLGDGKRAWSTQLPEASDGLVALLQDERVVVAHAQRAALLLAPDTGAVLGKVGQAFP